MRPITGRGNARSAADSSSSARPAPLRSRGAAARPADGSRSTGNEPEQFHHAHVEARRQGRGQRCAERFCGGADVSQRPRQQPQRRQVLRETLGAQVEPQRRLERRQRQLADAQRALQRELADAVDGRLAADDQPGLRPAEQLVAAEGDDVAAGGDLLARRRLARQAIGGQVDERAAAQIGGQRYDWYIFNLADVAIVAGVIGLLYDMAFGHSAAKAP
jgi:hypothetical protein